MTTLSLKVFAHIMWCGKVTNFSIKRLPAVFILLSFIVLTSSAPKQRYKDVFKSKIPTTSFEKLTVNTHLNNVASAADYSYSDVPITITSDFVFIEDESLQVNSDFVNVIRPIKFDNLKKVLEQTTDLSQKHHELCLDLVPPQLNTSFVVASDSTEHTWQDAKDKCEAMDMQLPEIRTRDQMHSLATFMQEQDPNSQIHWKVYAGLKLSPHTHLPLFNSDQQSYRTGPVQIYVKGHMMHYGAEIFYNSYHGIIKEPAKYPLVYNRYQHSITLGAYKGNPMIGTPRKRHDKYNPDDLPVICQQRQDKKSAYTEAEFCAVRQADIDKSLLSQVMSISHLVDSVNALKRYITLIFQFPDFSWTQHDMLKLTGMHKNYQSQVQAPTTPNPKNDWQSLFTNHRIEALLATPSPDTRYHSDEAQHLNETSHRGTRDTQGPQEPLDQDDTMYSEDYFDYEQSDESIFERMKRNPAAYAIGALLGIGTLSGLTAAVCNLFVSADTTNEAVPIAIQALELNTHTMANTTDFNVQELARIATAQERRQYNARKEMLLFQSHLRQVASFDAESTRFQSTLSSAQHGIVTNNILSDTDIKRVAEEVLARTRMELNPNPTSMSVRPTIHNGTLALKISIPLLDPRKAAKMYTAIPLPTFDPEGRKYTPACTHRKIAIMEDGHHFATLTDYEYQKCIENPARCVIGGPIHGIRSDNCLAKQFFDKDKPLVKHKMDDDLPFFHTHNVTTIFSVPKNTEIELHCENIRAAGPDHVKTLSGKGSFNNELACRLEIPFYDLTYTPQKVIGTTVIPDPKNHRISFTHYVEEPFVPMNINLRNITSSLKPVYTNSLLDHTDHLQSGAIGLIASIIIGFLYYKFIHPLCCKRDSTPASGNTINIQTTSRQNSPTTSPRASPVPERPNVTPRYLDRPRRVRINSRPNSFMDFMDTISTAFKNRRQANIDESVEMTSSYTPASDREELDSSAAQAGSDDWRSYQTPKKKNIYSPDPVTSTPTAPKYTPRPPSPPPSFDSLEEEINDRRQKIQERYQRMESTKNTKDQSPDTTFNSGDPGPRSQWEPLAGIQRLTRQDTFNAPSQRQEGANRYLEEDYEQEEITSQNHNVFSPRFSAFSPPMDRRPPTKGLPDKEKSASTKTMFRENNNANWHTTQETIKRKPKRNASKSSMYPDLNELANLNWFDADLQEFLGMIELAPPQETLFHYHRHITTLREKKEEIANFIKKHTKVLTSQDRKKLSDTIHEIARATVRIHKKIENYEKMHLPRKSTENQRNEFDVPLPSDSSFNSTTEKPKASSRKRSHPKSDTTAEYVDMEQQCQNVTSTSLSSESSVEPPAPNSTSHANRKFSQVDTG